MVDHYLDDFFMMGPDSFRVDLDRILAVCSVPPAMEKLEGPSQCMTFLGIEIDTASGHIYWMTICPVTGSLIFSPRPSYQTRG